MYIGIIGRINENRITYNKEIIDIIHKYGFIPLGIITNTSKNAEEEFINLKNIIDLCSGFILQGGNEYYDIDLLITKYLYNKDIPTLGICLGMQTMGVCFNGILDEIDNHNSDKKYVHNIRINENSKLYEIIKNKNILVNSRHNSYVKTTNLEISAYNNVIEALEDKNKKFFLGVQWHPESLMDNNNILLFERFFSSLK